MELYLANSEHWWIGHIQQPAWNKVGPIDALARRDPYRFIDCFLGVALGEEYCFGCEELAKLDLQVPQKMFSFHAISVWRG